MPYLLAATVILSLIGSTSGCFAQTADAANPMVSKVELPDAPGMSSSSVTPDSQSTASYTTGRTHALSNEMASTTDKYIEPGESAPRLTVGNKVALGLKDSVSPMAVVGWAITAGYEQAMNGSPNYGTNASAYAQRFGASAARASSEGIFSDSIMASVLHEDPRYYRMGPGNNFFKRVGYAVSRTMITKTDSGRTTPNLALLSGNLGGAYLTKAYYPALNTSNTEVLKTYGGSIGGSALGFVVSEFFGGFNLFHKSAN